MTFVAKNTVIKHQHAWRYPVNPPSKKPDPSAEVPGEARHAPARTELDAIPHCLPADQPLSVREIAQRLFAPYEVEAGHAHLGGCTLEDRPILRLSFAAGQGDTPRPCSHLFIGPDGIPLPADVAQALELDGDRIVPLAGKKPRISRDRFDRLLEAGEEAATARGVTADAECCGAVLIWCKFAEGKICFAIGRQSAEVAFADWAQLFATDRSRPPPMTGPDGEKQSYRIGADDEGRISIAEAIATCDVSQRRVLETELATCPVTGRRALPRYLEACPIGGRRLVPEAFVTCNLCRQRVDPAVVTSKRCRACRSLHPVSKDEPQMARVLCVFPALDRWRRWKMAETETAYILRGDGLLRHLLVVLDKDSLQPIRVAWRGPLLSSWSDVPQVQAGQLLKREDGP